jgi:hypothetical protein
MERRESAGGAGDDVERLRLIARAGRREARQLADCVVEGVGDIIGDSGQADGRCGVPSCLEEAIGKGHQEVCGHIISFIDNVSTRR